MKVDHWPSLSVSRTDDWGEAAYPVPFGRTDGYEKIVLFAKL